MRKSNYSESHEMVQANQRPQISLNDEHSIYSISLLQSKQPVYEKERSPNFFRILAEDRNTTKKGKCAYICQGGHETNWATFLFRKLADELLLIRILTLSRIPLPSKRSYWLLYLLPQWATIIRSDCAQWSMTPQSTK